MHRTIKTSSSGRHGVCETGPCGSVPFQKKIDTQKPTPTHTHTFVTGHCVPVVWMRHSRATAVCVAGPSLHVHPLPFPPHTHNARGSHRSSRGTGDTRRTETHGKPPGTPGGSRGPLNGGGRVTCRPVAWGPGLDVSVGSVLIYCPDGRPRDTTRQHPSLVPGRRVRGVACGMPRALGPVTLWSAHRSFGAGNRW